MANLKVCYLKCSMLNKKHLAELKTPWGLNINQNLRIGTKLKKPSKNIQNRTETPSYYVAIKHGKIFSQGVRIRT